METPKTFLTFSQEKAFLIFQETETPKRKLFLYFRKRKYRKKFLIVWEMELACISGNGNPKKLLVFQEVTSHAREMKKPL